MHAVGLLNSEDDVERYLFEGGSLPFHTVIKGLRDRVALTLRGGITFQDTLQIHSYNDESKKFAAYAAVLLVSQDTYLQREFLEIYLRVMF